MNSNKDNPARQRIARFVDENSFMEIGSLVAARNTDFNLSDAKAPSDGVIVGHGLIDGKLVFLYSQDSTVLGGTIGEMHAKKIAQIYDMAMKMGAPVIGFIDCGGLRLQESVDALDGFGAIYAKQIAASGVIPQICAVFGSCGGGLSVVPALCDFAFLETEKGRMFLNSPNAIPGNRTEKLDTADAGYQSRANGCIDAVGTEEEILDAIRSLIDILPSNCQGDIYTQVCTDDLNRTCEGLTAGIDDPRYLLSRISDDSFFYETKKDYAKDMVTGFVKFNGMTVGAVANCRAAADENGKPAETFQGLSADGCRKAADFVTFCDAFSIPILTVTNVEGFAPTEDSERGLARALACMTRAFANATVAKVNLVTGQAFGSAGVFMNSKSIGADLVYAWEEARVGMMQAELAVKIMYPDADAAELSEKAKVYDHLQNDAATAAARGYVDLILAPEDTRKYLVAAFEMLYTKYTDVPYKKHNTK